VKTISLDEVQRIAADVAHGYARKWRYVDGADLLQEAILAVLHAQKTFDPSRGTKFAAYAGQAASYAVKMYLWRNSFPVNESVHKRDSLMGVVRVSIHSSKATRLKLPLPPPDERLHEARWTKRVQDWVKENDASGLGAAALLADLRPREVAEEKEVPSRKVQQALGRVRTKARQSEELRQLWEER
jgi:DNA-directed RNA polymerase sigma subunit (sigma70/sigma32)